LAWAGRGDSGSDISTCGGSVGAVSGGGDGNVTSLRRDDMMVLGGEGGNDVHGGSGTGGGGLAYFQGLIRDTSSIPYEMRP